MKVKKKRRDTITMDGWMNWLILETIEMLGHELILSLNKRRRARCWENNAGLATSERLDNKQRRIEGGEGDTHKVASVGCMMLYDLVGVQYVVCNSKRALLHLLLCFSLAKRREKVLVSWELVFVQKNGSKKRKEIEGNRKIAKSKNNYFWESNSQCVEASLRACMRLSFDEHERCSA